MFSGRHCKYCIHANDTAVTQSQIQGMLSSETRRTRAGTPGPDPGLLDGRVYPAGEIPGTGEDDRNPGLENSPSSGY